MKKPCHFCGSPASVHLTDVVNQHKKEMHLCEACAQKHDLLPGGGQDVNLPALLHLLLGQPVAAVSAEAARQRCPTCGQSYLEFRQSGRLGCADDYAAFRGELTPLLERLHRSTRHAGKSPRRRRPAADQAELAALLANLQEAVRAERYEEAARLRDEIRQKECPG